jgi:hypothetical protein
MRRLLPVIVLTLVLLSALPNPSLADNGAEFDAEPVERLYYKVLAEGETDELTLEVENTGTATWSREDEVELRSASFFKLLSETEYLSLEGPVAPGEMATWSLPIGESGTLYRRLQMVNKEQPFGSDFALIVILLPEEVADKRDELEQSIQEIIDEWVARGEEELDWAMEEIKKLAEESLKDLWARLIDTFKEWARDTGDQVCNTLCGSAALVTVGAAVAVSRRRR